MKNFSDFVYNDVMKEFISYCKNMQEVAHIKNLFAKESLPEWKDFLSLLNKRIKEETVNPLQSVYDFGGTIIGNVNFWDHVSISAEEIEIEEIKNFLTNIHPNKYIKNIVFMSLTSKESDYVHSDMFDVFYLQCLGSVKWNITEKDGRVIEYILEPGDVIFVPMSRIHEVVPLEPRAAISFLFNA